MEKIFRLFALITILSAIFLGYVGYQYRKPYANAASSVVIPVVGGMAETTAKSLQKQISELPPSIRGPIGFKQSGLLIPMGAVSALLVLLSIIFMSLSAKAQRARIEKENHRITWGEEHQIQRGGESQSSSPSSVSLGKMSVDDTMLESTNEEDNLFSSVESVVALAHTALDEEMCRRILKSLRPDIIPYIDIMTEKAREKISRQILNHYILSKKRAQKNISPDQFRLQDVRVNECLRETIVRRFMPAHPENFSSNVDMANYIGHIYDVSEQPGIQQKTFSAAEDWMDISLRNSTEILEIPSAAIPAATSRAAAPPPAAAPADDDAPPENPFLAEALAAEAAAKTPPSESTEK